MKIIIIKKLVNHPKLYVHGIKILVYIKCKLNAQSFLTNLLVWEVMKLVVNGLIINVKILNN